MKKHFLRLIVLILTLFVSQPVYPQELKIAALTNWPPFSDYKLPDYGIVNDITKTALENMGYKVTIEMVPWIRALQKTKQGFYQVLTGVWYNEEREKSLEFSKPLFKNKLIFIKRAKDPFEYQNLRSLTGKTVGILRAYSYPQNFTMATNFNIDVTNNITLNIKKLIAGRIDLVLEDLLVAKHHIKTNMPNIISQVNFTQNALASKNLHTAFSKKLINHKEIALKFNEEIDKMKKNGVFDELMKKHNLK